MQTLNQYSQLINAAIDSIKLPSQPQRLYAPISYTMALGGKRLRPVLMLLTCDALGGDFNHALNQAVGLEYFHNFTLLHDDVMDKADLRRGKPTVHCKWDDNTAILSGDAMLTLATQFMAKSLNGDRLKRILEVYNETAMEIYEGQQYDMDYEEREDVTIDEYINMIRLKTSVLFGCACKIGAIIAHATEDTQNEIYKFGVNLGLAFQLQDDYLDVYGDCETFGKELGGDILNRKRTFMLISAYQKANKEQTDRLDALFSINDPEHNAEKIKGVKDLYNELSIPELVNHKIENYMNIAIESLNNIVISTQAKDEFKEFVNNIMLRKK